jgi:hypothetical protein
MSYYCVHVPVGADEVEVIRKELDEYLEKAGAIAIVVVTPDPKNRVSPELAKAIQSLFMQLISACSNDQFEGMN